MYSCQSGSLHLLRTGTADSVVLCFTQDHAQLRARVALVPEHMSKLDVSEPEANEQAVP